MGVVLSNGGGLLSCVACLHFWGWHGRLGSGGVFLHVRNVRYPLLMFIGVFDGFSSSLAHYVTDLGSVLCPLSLRVILPVKVNSQYIPLEMDSSELSLSKHYDDIQRHGRGDPNPLMGLWTWISGP